MTRQFKNYVNQLKQTPVDGHPDWVQIGEGSIGTIYKSETTASNIMVIKGSMNSIRYSSFNPITQEIENFHQLDDAITFASNQ